HKMIFSDVSRFRMPSRPRRDGIEQRRGRGLVLDLVLEFVLQRRALDLPNGLRAAIDHDVVLHAKIRPQTFERFRPERGPYGDDGADGLAAASLAHHLGLLDEVANSLVSAARLSRK